MGNFFSAISDIFSVFALIVCAICYIAVYLVSAYGIYKSAVNNQVSNPWIAFVPILQVCIPGKLTEEYFFKGYKIPKLEFVLPLIVLIKTILTPLTGIVIWFVKLLLSAIIALILHKFFYLYKPQKAFLYSILCFIFGEIAFAIIMLLLKDDSMIMSSGAYPYPFNEK